MNVWNIYKWLSTFIPVEGIPQIFQLQIIIIIIIPSLSSGTAFVPVHSHAYLSCPLLDTKHPDALSINSFGSPCPESMFLLVTREVCCYK